MRGILRDLRDLVPRGSDEREAFVWAFLLVVVSGFMLGFALEAGRYGVLLGMPQ